MEPRF